MGKLWANTGRKMMSQTMRPFLVRIIMKRRKVLFLLNYNEDDYYYHDIFPLFVKLHQKRMEYIYKETLIDSEVN